MTRFLKMISGGNSTSIMSTKNFLQIFLFIIFIYVFPLNGVTCFAEDKNVETSPEQCIDPDEQFEFSEKLFQKQEYDKAAIEYYRFIYFFPDEKRIEAARYGMGKSYFAAGEYDRAIAVFKEIITIHGNTPTALIAYFDISRCFLQLDDREAAIIQLKKLMSQTKDQDLIDRAWYEIGWISIESQSQHKIPDWGKAGNIFDNISRQNNTRYQVELLHEKLATGQDIRFKNPTLSGFLSVMPGGGYFYCNRYRDALVAFLLNGGLMLASIASFESDNPALGGVIAFVEAGFYAGNFYGGITSAHKFNKDKIRSFIRMLEETGRVSLSANGDNKKIGVLFGTYF